MSGKLNTNTFLLARLPKELKTTPSSPPRHISETSSERPSSPLGGLMVASTAGPQVAKVIQEYSICVAFSVFSHLHYSTVLSYFDQSDILRLAILDDIPKICAIDTCHELAIRIFPDTWYQICIVASNATLTFYHHGTLLTSQAADTELPLGGSLVIGQDQDSPVGGFSLGQAFRGQVAHLGLWPRALTPEEVLAVSQCDVPLPPDELLPWDAWNWMVSGSVQMSRVSHCHRPLRQTFPFWEKSTHWEAYGKLKKMGMVMAVPLSLEEIKFMALMLKHAPEQCANEYKSADLKYASVNVIYENATGEFVNFNDCSKLKYRKNISNILNTRSPLIDITSDGELSFKLHNKSCYFGEHQRERPIFHLRGLCDDNTYGTDFSEYVLSVSDDQRLYFAGLYGAIIIQTDTRWDVMHRYKNQTMASTYSSSLPLGRRKWNVTNIDPSCSSSLGHRILTLSICSEDEFTCTDGSCVPLHLRCDLFPNCRDWSDEHYCKTVLLPDGYLSRLPPPPLIIFKLGILFSNIELDLLSMTFTVKLRFRLEWKDGRIDFLNLQSGDFVNEVSMEGEGSWAVWVPKLQLSELVDHGPFDNPAVYVMRRMEGQPGQDDVKFAGDENPLVFSNEVMPKFKCPLQLENYPWDSQVCSISINISNIRTELVFVRVGATYLGTRELQEYDFGEYWVNSSLNSVQLFFQLSRRHEKHVWTTIVPTSLLLLISYGTLFIPVESFSERGTMSLTTLLVLVSLYTETLSSLPVTSYNKKIEKWYILLIVYVSLIIAVHLATSNPLQHGTATVRPVSQETNQSAKSQKLFLKINKAIRRWLFNARSVLTVARRVFAVALLLILALYSLDLF